MDKEFKRLEELDEKSREEVIQRIKQSLDLYFKQLSNSTPDSINNNISSNMTGL
jgi:hypothetical protein